MAHFLNKSIPPRGVEQFDVTIFLDNMLRVFEKSPWAQSGAPDFGGLETVISAWHSLPHDIKTIVLDLIRSVMAR